MKADKPKVVDEVWDEARIRSFLHRDAVDGEPNAADYNILLRAYQGMRPGDFTQFIAAFVAEGHDLNVTDARGQSIAAFVARHRHGAEFLAILEAAGARRQLPQPHTTVGAIDTTALFAEGAISAEAAVAAEIGARPSAAEARS